MSSTSMLCHTKAGASSSYYVSESLAMPCFHDDDDDDDDQNISGRSFGNCNVKVEHPSLHVP